MTVRTVYCSACDRNVEILEEAQPAARTAGDDGSAAVCLDYGQKCTGEMCPVLARPSAVIRQQLDVLRAQP